MEFDVNIVVVFVNWKSSVLLVFRVDRVKTELDECEKSSGINFDLFANSDQLMLSGNDLYLEYSNVLAFPLKLIGNYLDNVSLSFSDGF